MQRRTTIVAALLLLFLFTPDALGQRNKDYEFEIAVLPSVTYVFRSFDRERDYWESNDPDSYTVIALPSFAPALRVSVWSVQPVVLDFGITVLEAESERGVEESQLMLETGIGMDLAKAGQRVRPFGGAIIGMMSGDVGELGGYLGAQGGVRYFFRDYAATRVQVGFRRTISDDSPRIRAIEIAFGLGFFI
jgi:hypothetical protein